MRLIDTTTLHLREFFDSQRPAYSILSHTWGSEEVTFQEWMESRVEAKSGFQKIERACRVARAHRHDYIWVDTNCIDKKSSAELSEAINSMFSWYQAASICFIHLEDFPAGAPIQRMSECRWFTRGWTLQELLAPRHLVFFNAAWESFGTKTNLCAEIHQITAIDVFALSKPSTINDACVAQKMSWASSRQTTRKEDMAYCLLGLFGINMPLLYGEGDNAFLRLQAEIIKVSTDQSIFAWDSPKDDPLYTMLAPSPAAFRHCHKVKRDLLGEQKSHPRHREFTITNFGLNISLPLLVQNQRTYFGALNCRPEMHDELICIPLSVPGSMPTEVFVRDGSRGVIMIPHRYFPTEPTSIYVPRDGDVLRGIRLPIGPPKPAFGQVSCLLFPLNNVLEVWQINESQAYMRIAKSFHHHRTSYLDVKSLVVRRRRSRGRNTQWIFIILWQKAQGWGHVCSEVYHGQPEDHVEDRTLQRVLDEGPPRESVASCGGLKLEVGFDYSLKNDSGGRSLPLFLSCPPNTMD
ncbi:Vegetative incompatibility protein HET-E-1 [Colletotrichum fructicola]|nr:Vegetative incompatibility protein HET-E-1 [Colletotrichum fructicola]